MSRHQYCLIYDGQCPVCATGARYAAVDARRGNFHCVDARKDDRISQRMQSAGIDMDQGMVLMIDDTLVQGEEAARLLAQAAPRHGLFNRANRWLFGSKRRASVFYPPLLTGRNLLLRILGRHPINQVKAK